MLKQVNIKTNKPKLSFIIYIYIIYIYEIYFFHKHQTLICITFLQFNYMKSNMVFIMGLASQTTIYNTTYNLNISSDRDIGLVLNYLVYMSINKKQKLP